MSIQAFSPIDTARDSLAVSTCVIGLALFEKLFREGGEFYSLTEIKNELAQFSDEELMRGLEEAVRKDIICESPGEAHFEPTYFR